MNAKEKAKELLAKIKAAFDVTPAAPPATPPPAAPAPPAVPDGTVFTLQDGTQISIVMTGDIPAVGDKVSINALPAPAGDLVLADGSIITCDASGAITAYTPIAPVTTDVPAQAATPPATPPPAAPTTPPAKQQVTAAQMADMMTKFAVGTPEERLTNLELISKALMQSEFGWQIMEQQRLADTNAAIAIYNNTLKMESQKITDQKEVIDRHEKTIKDLFELVEILVNEPGSEPKTLHDAKKEKFLDKKEANLQRLADAFKKMKKEAHTEPA